MSVLSGCNRNERSCNKGIAHKGLTQNLYPIALVSGVSKKKPRLNHERVQHLVAPRVQVTLSSANNFDLSAIEVRQQIRIHNLTDAAVMSVTVEQVHRSA